MKTVSITPATRWEGQKRHIPSSMSDTIKYEAAGGTFAFDTEMLQRVVQLIARTVEE